MKKIFLKAFTLAEVIIAMTLLGIIAAITIPNTIKNYNDYIYKVKWKKTISTFSNALGEMAAEHDMNLYKICNGYDANSRENCLVDEFAKYIFVTKKCENGNAFGKDKCFVDSSELKCLNGTKTKASWHYDSGFITKDGVNVVIWLWSFDNPIIGYDYEVDENGEPKLDKNGKRISSPLTGQKMIFDVNGHKGPNTFGRDVFGANINLSTHTFEPMGLHPERGSDEWYGKRDSIDDKCGVEKSAEVLLKK